MTAPKLTTLKRRKDFLRVRGGARWAGPCFVVEAKRRVAPDTAGAPVATARFGFTVTRQLGNAVVRNRIRRRLKAAIREVAGGGPPDAGGTDFVIIARKEALDRPFAALRQDLAAALARVARGAGKPKQGAAKSVVRREQNAGRTGSADQDTDSR